MVYFWSLNGSETQDFCFSNDISVPWLLARLSMELPISVHLVLEVRVPEVLIVTSRFPDTFGATLSFWFLVSRLKQDLVVFFISLRGKALAVLLCFWLNQ